MKTKPTIISTTTNEEGVDLLLRVDADLHYFSGHFPNNPILPGVVQLDWAVFYAKKHLSTSEHFDGMEVTKFQVPILPNNEILLSLKWEKQKIYFSYSSSAGKHASGRIKLSSNKLSTNELRSGDV